MVHHITQVSIVNEQSENVKSGTRVLGYYVSQQAISPIKTWAWVPQRLNHCFRTKTCCHSKITTRLTHFTTRSVQKHYWCARTACCWVGDWLEASCTLPRAPTNSLGHLLMSQTKNYRFYSKISGWGSCTQSHKHQKAGTNSICTSQSHCEPFAA